jgi:hypothetical protein
LKLATDDCEALDEAQGSYGDSWRQRGGVGAFMMLARKWDRIENQCKGENYDIFKVVDDQVGCSDGLLDDIRDLRRYLLLVDEHVCAELNKNRVEKTPTEGVEACSGYVDQD